jgi:hypothetical protein
MGRFPRFFARSRTKQGISGFLLLATLVTQISFVSLLLPQTAEAAVVTIDSTTNADANSFLFSGSQTVFTTDQVGYKFYRDLSGACVYAKTIDGGTSWTPGTVVDSQTDCISISVWYDQWTPNDFGSYIHIATMESASVIDRLFYNRLDTSDDSLLMGSTSVITSTTTPQVGTFVSGVNTVTLTKATDGAIYMATSDASDSFIVRCTVITCNTTSSWSEITNPFTPPNDNDWNILIPLATGDDVLLINRDISADDIQSRVWDGSAWSASWLPVDTSAVESSTYDVSMAATIDHTTGDVFLAYGADHDSYTTLDHDIRTAKYSAGSWSGTTAVFTNRAARGLHSVAIALDTNTSNVYVGYVLRTTPLTATTGQVFYATSTSAMSTWGTEQGPIGLAQNLYGIDMNIMSDERIYATWYDPNLDDVIGETLADIAPVTKVTPRGSATSTVNASTTNVYTGGSFALRESVTSRNVTDIVISERGTVAANTAISNVKVFYDLDTSAPYDCASESYSGSETQFGTTDTNGFSGADGTSAFTGLVSISPTQAMCLYTVVDVLDNALDSQTLSISIEDPNNDILVSGGSTVMPVSPVRLASSTQIRNDQLTLTHYHWRNDNGTEDGATSATLGVPDTPIPAMLRNSPRRLRVGVSNEGSITAPASQFRLEYAEAAPSCIDATGWTDVGATDDAWNMYDSAFLINGTNTIDIATSSGGVGNENSTFLTPNGGIRDTSSQTGSLTLTSANFVELEYSVIASSSAVEGTTYCFRVTNAGTELPVYSFLPEATVSADVTISATSTQVSSLLIPVSNTHIGGTFSIRENTATRTVSSITITEGGTVNATSGLDNILLRYDLDTSAPYNCASESYGGGEAQFGITDTDGFSGVNGSSTFSGSVNISTTSAMCVYVLLDVTTAAINAETIKLFISSGATDVVVDSGSVGPSTQVTLSGTTTLLGAILTQENYRWRNDNGTEVAATAAALENVQVTDHTASTSIRVRLGINNTGAATSSAAQYRLEFGPKVTTCSAVGVWTAVDASPNDDWNMFDSISLTNGADTTNIATTSAGVTDTNTTFLTPNGGVRDTSDTTGSITLSPTEYTELEYSITSTGITAFNTVYCFRLTNNGAALGQYDTYAEIFTAPKRDFKVQRGVVTLSATGTTLVAGLDYTAPATSSKAFVRITDTHHTAAGRTTAGGGALNADDSTAYISNPGNITTNFRISRPPAAISNTRATWEIVEFIGDPGTDNEMFVREQGTIGFASASTTATGTAIAGIGDDSDIVVYITGIENRDVGRNLYYAGQVTAEWDAQNNRPIFRRGAGGAIINVSYAVVEYAGINWRVQRVEHTYSTTTVASTTDITPVNSAARTFLHTQKRMSNLQNVNNFGHEVWLSSIGAVSFRLEPLATTPAGHTSVAWVIENQQTSVGAMKVQRTNGTTDAGTEPVTINISIFTPIDSMTNTSIFANTRVVGANTNFPLVFAGARIMSTTTYELWRSEATGQMTYRTEIVEWPINGLAVRQNDYWFFADNDALRPTDIWPPGVVDMGENTPLTASDEPLGEGERIRLRMTLLVANATFPAGLYDFKLQYGLRSTPSCSAIGSWTDLGAPGSGAAWRGFDAPGITDGVAVSVNPPDMDDLLVSSADIAGIYAESNPTPANPYLSSAGEDIEFDWNIQHNGAIERSVYCFRMVRSDGTTLDGYFDYPQIRTAGFSPVTKNWRWYGDSGNETPSTALSAETVAPTGVVNTDEIALRITVGERKTVRGENVKFKLQYDESPNFTNPRDVVATSSCTATSTWCYASGGGMNNATITTKVLTDADACVASVGNGCGTHNSSGAFVPGDVHQAAANREYSFYLRHAAARVGAVYYFRLYEVLNELPVVPNTGESYPSLVAESARLSLAIGGLPAGTTTSGITTNASSSPSAITFGSLGVNTDYYAAHRLSVDTNATEGYRILMFARQQLLNGYGTPIASITGTNAAPTSWATGCLISADGCVGYHTTDATLAAPATRFAPLDSYAGLHTTPAEVMYSPIPATESHDIVYRVRVGAEQPAGTYETEMVYIAIPTY